MKEQPVFSIVMPSYNSSSVIDKALASVRMQDFDQELIEILVIDGGSTDNTREIALKYGAVFLDKPKSLPIHARAIGFMHAKGRFLIKMDTDEVLTHSDQLSKRAVFFAENPQLKCLVANRLLPVKGCGVASSYLNYYGDPFTLFVYNSKKDILTTFKRNVVKSVGGGMILSFGKNDLKPIGDGGTTTISLEFARSVFGTRLNDVKFVCGITDEIIKVTGLCGCIEGDEVRHYSNGTLKVFLAKLRYRIINNVFKPEESGFSAIEGSSPILARRKKLFYFYALSVLWPLFDSIKLAVYHMDLNMLLHFFYLYYVCFYIAYCQILKMLKHEKRNTIYGKNNQK